MEVLSKLVYVIPVLMASFLILMLMVPIFAGAYNLARSLTGRSDKGEKSAPGDEHINSKGSEADQ